MFFIITYYFILINLLNIYFEKEVKKKIKKIHFITKYLKTNKIK